MKLKLLKMLLHSQGGYILPLALILLVFGGLFVVPSLDLLNTSLNANRVVDEADMELYAADAGVEKALWEIQDNNFTLPAGVGDEEGVPFSGTPPNDITVDSVVVTLTKVDDNKYKITSVATSDDGSSTTVESRVQSLPGENLAIFDYGLASETTVTLGKDCTVTGDIYHETGFDPGSGFEHLDGEVKQGGLDWPTQEEIDAFAQAYKDEALAGGTYSGDYTIGIGDGMTVTSLGPLYITGNLEIEKDNIVDLQGTIYVDGYIHVDKDSEFTGSGSIIAQGNISLGKMADWATGGDSVIMSLSGDISFKKEGAVQGLIYAPDGSVSFKKDATVTGSVVANSIESARDSTFTFEESGEDLELPGYTVAWEVRTYTIQ